MRPFSELLADNILDAIDAIGMPTDGRMIALNSYENRVYQIGIEDSQPIVAKFYRPERWSDEQILEEHQFSQELFEAELPVVAPLQLDGKTLHHIDGWRIALFERKGGRSPDLGRRDDLQLLGRLMARMHLVAERHTFQHRPVVDIESYFEAPVAHLLAEHIPAHLCPQFEAAFDTLRQQFNDKLTQSSWPQAIRLHADAHPGNLLERDGDIHMVDLDDCRSGPAVQDLFLFAGGHDEAESRAAWDAILDGYYEFREFDYSELQWVEVLRTLRYSHYIGWLASRQSDPTFITAFPDYDTEPFWQRWLGLLNEQCLKLS